MKAYEFPAKVTSEGKLEFPDTLLKYLPGNQKVRFIILVNEPTDTEDEEDEDEAEEKAVWSRLAAEQFFADLSDEDAIYDEI